MKGNNAASRNVARLEAEQHALAAKPIPAVVGVQVDEMGRALAPSRSPILGRMFGPRVSDRRALIRSPWTAQKIISALQAVEYGDMGPMAELSEAMQDRDAPFLAFRQTRILAPSKLPWSIDPADDSPLAKEIADFVKAEIKSIPNFQIGHRDMFDAIGSGLSALWIDWQAGGRRHGGKAPSSPFRIDGIYHINPKRYRFHWNEERFLVLPDFAFGKMNDLGLMNAGPDTYNQILDAGLGIEPPAWKVIIHRTHLKSGHPAKAGLDRVCALPFYLSINALNDAATYCEVFGMPFRIAKYPPGMSDEDKAELAVSMDKLGSDASAIISNLVEFEWLESSSRTGGGMPFFELLKQVDRYKQLAWLGQDQTSTHNDAGGRTQVEFGGAPIRQDLIEADSVDAQATHTMQLCKPIVGFSKYGWDAADALCPRFKIQYEPPEDLKAKADLAKVLYIDLKLPVTMTMLAKEFKKELPPNFTDGDKIIDYSAVPAIIAPGPTAERTAPTDVPPVKKPVPKPTTNHRVLIQYPAPRFRVGGYPSMFGDALLNFAVEATDDDATGYEYASLQVNVTGDVAKQCLDLADGIPDDALAEKGREDAPHVTIKFGIDPAVTVAEIRAAIAGKASGSLTLGQTAFFALPDYDVVFLAVDSPDIVALNEAVVAAVKTTDTQPNYVPHLTLAYVESGRGHEFAGNGSMNGVKFDYSAVHYSDTEGNLTKIQAIRGHVRVTAPKAGTKMEALAPATGTWYEAERSWYSNVGRALLATGPVEEYERQRSQLEIDFAAAEAELSLAASGQAAIDDMQEHATERAASVFNSLSAQVREIVKNAQSLEAIPGLLRDAFGELDATKLQRLTARTMFVARLHGRASAKRTPPAS